MYLNEDKETALTWLVDREFHVLMVCGTKENRKAFVWAKGCNKDLLLLDLLEKFCLGIKISSGK